MILHCKDRLPDELIDCKFGCRIRRGELITNRKNLGECAGGVLWRGLLSMEEIPYAQLVEDYKKASDSSALDLNCFLKKIGNKDYEVIEDSNWALGSIHLFSTEALDIIKDWHDRYLKLIKNCNNDLNFSMTKGLDSRVILGFLLESISLGAKGPYSMKSTVRKFGAEDFLFTKKLTDLPWFKLNDETLKKHRRFELTGVYSEWSRFNNKPVGNKELVSLFNDMAPIKKVYPFLDPKLLQVFAPPDYLHLLILCMYYPFLIEIPVRTGGITYRLDKYNENYHPNYHAEGVQTCKNFIEKEKWVNPNPVNNETIQPFMNLF